VEIKTVGKRRWISIDKPWRRRFFRFQVSGFRLSGVRSENVYCLVPDDTLETAFEVFEGKHISTLPVVDSRNRKKVLGILKKSNLILAYNEKILKTHILQHRIK